MPCSNNCKCKFNSHDHYCECHFYKQAWVASPSGCCFNPCKCRDDDKKDDDKKDDHKKRHDKSHLISPDCVCDWSCKKDCDDKDDKDDKDHDSDSDSDSDCDDDHKDNHKKHKEYRRCLQYVLMYDTRKCRYVYVCCHREPAKCKPCKKRRDSH